MRSVMKWIVLIVLVSATRPREVLSTDACTVNPCQNNGMCVSHSSDQYTCMCLPQWKGTNCEIDKDECAANADLCRNGGTCVNGVGNYTCFCTPGYSGSNCLTDACHSNPCQNEGACELDVRIASGYFCMCADGFTGSICEYDIGDSACAINVCQNGGTCLEIGIQSVCFCQQGFTGQHCEVLKGCGSNPCLNDGTCQTSSTDINGYTCECQLGYTGRICQTVLEVQCIFNGETYSTEEVRINDCNYCWCRNGLWLCTKKYCGQIHIGFNFNQRFTLIENRVPEFERSLTEDLSTVFSIAESMITNFIISDSKGNIQVEFSLVSDAHSSLNIEDVADTMMSQFESSSYSFMFDGIIMNIVENSAKVTKASNNTESTAEPSSSYITMETVIIVSIVVGVSLVFAVFIGSVVILVHRQRSESTNLGVFEPEAPTPNNTQTASPKKVNYHNNLYKEAKNDADSVEDFHLHQ
ncbi:uncharacterized protein [Antedon mediterranea]|uniref:uncharacterized protein isoform X2 n=1 Tax=Antedon mediterranea TaxID=105859 RepID=UPI003AF515A6